MKKYMGENDLVLKVTDLSKSFSGVEVLNRIQFELRKGEVHALLGENGAGKSTFMKILLGIHTADSGCILFKGKEVRFKEPYDALQAGISMIHQEISLIPNMTVTENIWVGREKQFYRHGFIDRKRQLAKTRELLESLKVSIDPQAIVKNLSIANMQMVELVRAVSYHSDIIIMDEPTSALTQSEIEVLYRVVRGLAKDGVSVIFISHKLEEVFEICDRVTILRDGHYIETRECAGTDMSTLIRLIVGRELNQMFPKEEVQIGEEVLSVRQLSRSGVYENISFQVRQGEIVGICGLMGAGRTEIMRGLFGVDPVDSGEVSIRGKVHKIRSPRDAIGCGLGMVTEDRLQLGGIRILSIKVNMTLVYLKKLCTAKLFVRKTEEATRCRDMMELMEVKAASMNQTISQLSGGNQQKVIVGKWLMNQPDILILDEPTRGIDIGSKSEIHRLISKLAKQGMAILMVSSELPEILGMSDRILVIREGKIVAEHNRGDVDQEILIKEEFGTS
ncbi:sugar ABC transporter ATP-binding protein [Diplocloster hominis]|uniref:sugar ABC transporter ATP-binding protein n=1 Tax=Diplocloster hominis TaxID=3079010 RepID=UPI0031BB9826